MKIQKTLRVSKEFLSEIQIPIHPPAVIFLYGTLGAGKTTFVSHFLKNKFSNIGEIVSPTYMYYQKYLDNYHFDLYRLSSYEEFVQIGGEEILENNEGYIFIEWPQILESYIRPDVSLFFSEISGKEDEREIILEAEASLFSWKNDSERTK